MEHFILKVMKTAAPSGGAFFIKIKHFYKETGLLSASGREASGADNEIQRKDEGQIPVPKM
ncbi:MAG: hypothetical protein Q4D50_07830 [Eubacteriales bacterium]|nr:hypothetical protein [Eubacteriales bacterium]